MAHAYTLRLDVIDEVEESVIQQRIESALSKYSKYLVYHEYAAETKKPHFQGIVWSDQGHDTYKKYMEGLFPEWRGTRGCKGAGKRSFAAVKTDNYEIYITKDGDQRLIKGYTVDEVSELQSKSYQKAEKPKAVRKKDLTSFQKALEYVKSRGEHHLMEPQRIARVLIDYYTTQVRCEPSDYMIKNMVKSVMSQLLYNNEPERYERWADARAKQIIGCEFIFDF